MLSTLLVLVATAAPRAEVSYEGQLIDWGLAQRGRELEPEPAGQRIEELLVVTEEVFAASDPWPDLLNWIHVRTRDQVVLREVLLGPGDLWDEALVAETERILRRLPFLAVARVVAVKGRAGGVGLLVVTKDRLSLRMNSFYNVVGDLLQVLLLRPTEGNFLGRGQRVAIELLLLLDTLQISESFHERRLFGTHLSLFESAGIVVNRATGQAEGTVGEVVLSWPLASLDQRWAFSVEGGWTLKTQRTFCGPVVCDQEGDGVKVPRIHEVRLLRAEASLTRSFGSQWKTELTGAIGGYSRRYTPPAAGVLTDAQRALLEDEVLPRSEDATYVSVFARFFQPDFRVLKNLDTFDLTEDFQLGPLVQLGARWAIPTVTPTHFVELGGSVRYRWLAADNLLTVSLAGAVRVLPGGESVNRHLAFEVVNATPPFEGGRLVSRVLVDLIDRDLSRRLVLLGGGNGLRGALAESLSGRNLLLVNVEYRTRSFELRTFFFGFVLFYDAGSAFDAHPAVTHTLGLGIRILVPQWDPQPIRFDLGFVIGGPGRLSVDRTSSTYGQVTELRPAFLDYPLGGGCESPSCR